MSADIFDTNNILGILLAGRKPEWLRQGDLAYPNGLPDPGSGVALRNSPRTQVLLDMREQVRHRICRVNIRVPDLAGVYRTFIDGTAVDFDAGGAGATSILDVLTGIKNALNANVVVNLVITASLEDRDNDGTDDTLLITGIKALGADYTIGVTNAAGTQELDVTGDPTSADARIYLTDKPPKAGGVALPNVAATSYIGLVGSGDWRQPNGAQYAAGFRGLSEFFDTAGYDRLYVELFNIVGPADAVGAPHTLTLTPRITIGPSILE